MSFTTRSALNCDDMKECAVSSFFGGLRCGSGMCRSLYLLLDSSIDMCTILNAE